MKEKTINFKQVNKLQRKGVQLITIATKTYLQSWYRFYEIDEEPDDEIVEEFAWRYRSWIQQFATKHLKEIN